MYIMLGLIFNIKRRRASFFVLVPTRPAVLAETPLFCLIRISVIKTVSGTRLPLYAAYSPEIIKIAGERRGSSLSGKRDRCGNAYGDIRFTAGTSMALIYKINVSVNLTKALQKTLNFIFFQSGPRPRPNPPPAAN